jgi:nucleotide-binding universal stress UspA family protein
MNTIVVPTDFSPAASNAVDYAVELAKYFNARIILVNAFPVPISSYEAGVPMQSNYDLRETAEQGLEIIRRGIYMKHQFDFDIDCIAEMGDPYYVIEKAAAEVDADLIVMGIIGDAGKLKEYLIGSTAVEVARKSEIPTFIIPENVKYHRIHKISFACDLESTEETDLVYIAKFFSNVFDAELEIVNVEKPLVEVTVQKAQTNMFIERKLENTHHKTVHITGDNVAHDLESYFASHYTDIILLNPKKHNLFYNLFHKSVTKELAFHSKLPILSIH